MVVGNNRMAFTYLRNILYKWTWSQASVLIIFRDLYYVLQTLLYTVIFGWEFVGCSQFKFREAKEAA